MTGIWKIGSADPLTLLCTATDASENVGTATAAPELDYGDDGKSKDGKSKDGKSNDDKDSKDKKKKGRKARKALVVVLPENYELSQNHPNPFNPSTQIAYSLPEAVLVTLTVYNTSGQAVAVLVDAFVSAGYHVAEWRADGVSAGMYFYRLQAGGFVKTRRMDLLK